MSVWWWLAAQMFSLWPTWIWMSKRALDGSDDPLGILALASLALIIWQIRLQLRPQPALAWLILGLILTVAATLASGKLPPLLTGLIAMAAMAATLLAFIPSNLAKLPIFGLAILALPLLSSLQFYAGYPLRVITAEISSWLLSIAYHVQREGSTLIVNNRQIIVDAPCSGVQMAWLGYFTACTVALWTRLHNARFILRLPLAGLIILLGNIIRNSILVALQAGETPLPHWLHEGIGLTVLTLVCLSIAALMKKTAPAAASHPLPHRTTPKRRAPAQARCIQKHKKRQSRPAPPPQLNISNPANTIHTVPAPTITLSIPSTGALVFLLCAAWTSHTAWATSAGQEQPSTATFIEWPYQWKGQPLRPLALTEVEERFARDFPGAIARMTDGRRTFIFRHVTRPTRMLHPAADCYRALGYSIHSEQLHTDEDNLLWRCFIATRQNQTLQVCEHIEDNLGQSYTDTSAWYWSAIGKIRAGPWTTITIAQPAGTH